MPSPAGRLAVRPGLSSGISVRRQVTSAVLAIAAIVGLTAVLLHEGDGVSITIIFLLYLAVVVALAAAGGPVVGLVAAVAAFLVVNYYFTEPVHTLDVADAERLAELIIFLAVSGTVAALVDTAGRRRDVIAARTAEANELAAANDLRTALLRAVSHDLRTPLATAKIATSGLLAEDVSLHELQRLELTRLADQEIDRLIGIVANLLDAGRLQAGVLVVDIAPVDLGQIVASARVTLPADDQSRIDVDVAPTLPPVLCDEALLERVFANLLANALAAAPGRVAVEAAPHDGAPARLVIDVIDHGPGLADEERDSALRAFHRFEDRSGRRGIGLGLPIVVGFCDAMAVGFELRETPGGGLTARLTLPVTS